jgi:hypothetical protein
MPKRKMKDDEKQLFEEVAGKIKEGGLHRSLKVPKTYTFKLAELERLNKKSEGTTFRFKGKDIKMTKLVKKRLQLAVNMMK